jgi:hypothetical protein
VPAVCHRHSNSHFEEKKRKCSLFLIENIAQKVLFSEEPWTIGK